jgi:ElaB/YqjD/DUF883 family membrane-anchored ribosome-binding protein
MNNNTSAAQPLNEPISELKSLASDIEALADEPMANCSAEALAKLRARFDAAQQKCGEVYDRTKQQVIAGAKSTDLTIRENPYQALAIALGVGVMVGLCVGRRGR